MSPSHQTWTLGKETTNIANDVGISSTHKLNWKRAQQEVVLSS